MLCSLFYVFFDKQIQILELYSGCFIYVEIFYANGWIYLEISSKQVWQFYSLFNYLFITIVKKNYIIYNYHLYILLIIMYWSFCVCVSYKYINIKNRIMYINMDKWSGLNVYKKQRKVEIHCLIIWNICTIWVGEPNG